MREGRRKKIGEDPNPYNFSKKNINSTYYLDFSYNRGGKQGSNNTRTFIF